MVGLDRPQRMEGVSWDGGVIDEYADRRPGTFDAHVRPASQPHVLVPHRADGRQVRRREHAELA